MTWLLLPKGIETTLRLLLLAGCVAIGIWLICEIIDIIDKIAAKILNRIKLWAQGTFAAQFRWELISVVTIGVAFLLIKNNLKTTLILLSVMLGVSIGVAIEIWLIFTIFKVIAWILIESMVWTRFWVRANFDDDLRSVADHRFDWVFSGLLGFCLSPLWPPLLPVSYLLKIAATPKFKMTRQLSGDFNLPADRLETLATHWDRQTRQNVAGNPNTPASILINLLPEFPRSVAENPAFALLRFADLNLMESIPESDLIKILTGRRVPALLIEESIRRRTPKLTAALLKCPDLSAETIEQILDAIDEFLVADVLFKHRHCNHRIRLIIATSPDLQNLKYALIPHLRRSARSHQLLELIAATGDREVHVKLLQAKHCPRTIGLPILHQSPNKLIHELLRRGRYDDLAEWLRHEILGYVQLDSRHRVNLRRPLLRSRRIGLSTKLQWVRAHPRSTRRVSEYPRMLLILMAIALIKYQPWTEVWRYLWRDRQRFLHIWKITVSPPVGKRSCDSNLGHPSRWES
jgi:hypothetical protein